MPMRPFPIGDGKIVHLPDVEQRTMTPRDERDDHGYQCDCHRRMGNEFWFLPAQACLRSDKRCDEGDRA